MIQYHAGAERYICNIQTHNVDEDYGFICVGGTDIIYFMHDWNKTPKEGMTTTQQYYQNAFTCLGFWAGHPSRLNRIHKDRDIERFICKLTALRLCNRFGITKEQYGMTPQSKLIMNYLDRLQP